MVAFELSKSADLAGGLYAIKTRNPKFRLQAGDFEVGCYRVGRAVADDIWTSFPDNDDAAPAMVEEQLWLPGFEDEAGVKRARKLVLAHLGNSEDGLGAVYLCVPSRIDKDRIAGWALAHPIWKQGDSLPLSVKPAVALVPEETVPEPQIGKIRRSKRDQAD